MNTVICRVYVHHRKNSWTKDKGNLDSPSISVIYYRTRLICVASVNRVCSPMHAKGKKKTLAHFVPTHSSWTPSQLYTSSTSIAVATLSSTVVVAGRRSFSKQHGISPLLFSAAYLHRHSGLWSTGVFCGIGPGIFLMEKVINLCDARIIKLQ